MSRRHSGLRKFMVICGVVFFAGLGIARKNKVACKQDIGETLRNLDPLTSQRVIASEIEKFIAVKSQAGRMGFSVSGTTVGLNPRESAEVASLIVQGALTLEQFKKVFAHFGKNHPTGNTEEWIRAIGLAVQLKIDPMDLSQELKSFYKKVQLVEFHELSFGKKSDHGQLSFSEVFDVWILSRQLSKSPKAVISLVNSVEQELPRLTLGEALDLLLWQHISAQELEKIRADLAWIMENFILKTRRPIGFSTETSEVRLNFEQALVIQKLSVISRTSLETLLDQFQKVSVSKDVQEVEDIISPIRDSVMSTLDELMK